MGKFTNAIRLPSAKFPTVDISYSGVVLDLVDVDVPAFNINGQIDGVVTNEDGEVLQQVDVTLETATGKVILHTGGAIYYFNPATATSKWIWSRPQMLTIGRHIFCA